MPGIDVGAAEHTASGQHRQDEWRLAA